MHKKKLTIQLCRPYPPSSFQGKKSYRIHRGKESSAQASPASRLSSPDQKPGRKILARLPEPGAGPGELLTAQRLSSQLPSLDIQQGIPGNKEQ